MKLPTKRTRFKEGVFNKQLADELTVQCLRYMYRILSSSFEARPARPCAINFPLICKATV